MTAVPGHKNFPGFDSPAVGFEAPFEMLEACHQRVQRTLDLLVRLQEHTQTHGCDKQARQAATDVMRYFDVAAPLHHQDEEIHVFPAVLAGGDATLASAVRQLVEQHRQMEARWAALRTVLTSLVACPTWAPEPFLALRRDIVTEFVSMYGAHIRLEEDVVYPAARNLLDSDQKHAMGADMNRRRGADARPPGNS